MGGIFVSYRRADSSGYAGRLADDLSARFGAERVFRDVQSIGPGVDFVKEIERAVHAADAVVPVLGREWLSVVDDAGNRRLDEPDDPVRLELELALKLGVPVVPVLVEGATMPAPETLPPSLAQISRINAIELSDLRWDYDVGRLGDHLAGLVGDSSRPAPPAVDQPDPAPHRPRRGRRRAGVIVAAGGILLGAALLAGGGDESNGGSTPVGQVTSTSSAEQPEASTVELGKEAAAGSFVFEFERASHVPGTDGREGTVTIEASVSNLAMRALSPRTEMFLSSRGNNYPLLDGDLPPIPAESRGRATMKFPVGDFDFADATLLIGAGDVNRTVVPLGSDEGLKANLPRELPLAGVLRAGPYTLTVTGGLVTPGHIGTLAPGTSAPKGRLAFTLFYDFAVASGASSSFPNRELSLLLPDGTAVTVGDYSDPHITGGNTARDLFAGFNVADPPDGQYVLRFVNGDQRGELTFRIG